MRNAGRAARLVLVLAAWLLCAPLAAAEPAVGDWTGLLGALHLNLHIASTSGGKLEAYVLSVDQGDQNLVFDKVEATADTLHLESARLPAVFDGRWDAAESAWVGTWRQRGPATPLTLKRGAFELPVKAPRPQTPKPPFPYRQEEVSFQSPGARLAGTLTLPQGKGPFPAAILIAGSGAHARNERILDHQPFLLLADALTRRGIAVLRYDKRGTGGSIGDYGGATTRDFADDAQAAVAFLRGRADIDPGKIGLIGHSEGGVIAPMVAADDPKIGFVVLLAGPAVDGEAILLEQTRLIRIASGQSPEQVQASLEALKTLLDLIKSGADASQLRAAQGLPPGLDAGQQASSLPGQLAWMRYFLAYDPAPALRRLRMPVLALSGSKDLQVPPVQNLEPLKSALAGDSKAAVMELPGLNHLFQTADTGAPTEYGHIEETFSAQALKIMGDWIVMQIRQAA